MSFSDEYKAGYSGNYGTNIDTFSYSFQMGQKDRERQMREGTYGSGGGGGGAGMVGGGGIVLVAFMVILAFCAFVIALISYPVAAVISGGAFMIGTAMMGGGMNFVGLVFALMVPVFIAYLIAFKLEQKAAGFRPYRIFRQWWRIVTGTYLVYFLGYALLTHDPEQAGFFEYAIAWGALIPAPYLMYANSIRLDRKYELEPIRFRWLERIVSPIKNRLIPAVNENLRETPRFTVKDAYNKSTMDVQVSNGTVRFGETTIPVGNVKNVSYERERRGMLIAAGVILPIAIIVMVGKMNNEDFTGFFPQLFGALGLGAGIALLLWGFIQATPPGRLQGPFRIVNFYLAKSEEENGQVYLKFAHPKDERMFVQAIENSLKAIPVPEPVAPVPAENTPEGGRLRRLVPFKF